MKEEIIIERKTPQITKVILAFLISAAIFGLLGYWYGGKNDAGSMENAVEVSNDAPIPPIPSEPDSPSSDESETYKNTIFGFSLDLPKGFHIEETQMFEGATGVVLKFGEIKSDRVSEYNWVELKYYDDQASLETLENMAKQEAGTDISERTEFTIDGQKAISFNVGGMASGKTILVSNGKAGAEISVYPESDDTRAFAESLALSFKFKK